MENNNLIGKRINSALALRDKKQKELAEYLGVKPNVVSYFCNGSRVPNIEQIRKIAEIFNVSADYLLGLSDIATANADIKNACEVTGLSEKAIENLAAIKNNTFDEVLCPVISGIIENDSFTALINSIWFVRECSISEIYTQEAEKNLHKITENNEFSLDIKEHFFKRFANCFDYSADSLYQDTESRRDNNFGWTDLDFPENYGLMRAPNRFKREAQEQIELYEYRSAKYFQNILEEYITDYKKEYPRYKLSYNELMKKLYRYDHVNEDTETEEEKRFGEYIKSLFDEKEVSDNAKHNPEKE